MNSVNFFNRKRVEEDSIARKWFAWRLVAGIIYRLSAVLIESKGIE